MFDTMNSTDARENLLTFSTGRLRGRPRADFSAREVVAAVVPIEDSS